jgi:hypothetical protein
MAQFRNMICGLKAGSQRLLTKELLLCEGAGMHIQASNEEEN